jgi:bla regulator protein BlaR1
MNPLNHLVQPALLRAMGYTLLHSLWQGAVLALVVALLLSCLRQQAAVVRYRVAAVGLTALVGLAVLTFGYYYATMPLAEPLTSQAITPAGYAAAVARAHHPLVAASPTDWHGWVDGATSYLEQHLRVVVALWLLGVTITLGRLGLALRYVQRLRRHRLGDVPAVWQECLTRLSARAGLARPVQLRVSALVPSPLVIGHFKPLILLPLGLLSGLTGAELEMILAHELAHIVRKDYLFNLVQAVAETVFFYHPAVWFLAAVLHAERENCCDDLATCVGGNPRQLARALVAVAELAHAAPTPRLTLAVAGLHDSLLSRVQRLLHARPAKTNGFFPASFALLGVGLALAAVLISAQVAKLPTHTTLTRARRAATTKHTPDDAPRTGRVPLTTSDNELQALFQRQLQADGLLPDADNYVLTLTSDQLRVNGRPQSAALVARYQQLYEAATGYRMTATTSYQTQNEVTYQVDRKPVVAATASPPDTAHAALRRQLQRDGLLGGDTRPLQVEITKAGVLLVNGRARPPHLLRRYRVLLGLPADSAGRTTAFALAVR